MGFRSFARQEINGELKFLPEGCIDDNQCSPSSKSVNNEAPVIDAKPLTYVHPLDFVEDVADSDDASVEDNENPLRFSSEGSKMAAQASKVAGEATDTLNVDSDPDIHEFPLAKEVKDSSDYHWVMAHVTPPSWKKHLRQISIKQLCDIHDRVYMRQVVLGNVLNSKTRELIYALYKATASCDAIQARELKKDRAYAELEKKCNKALLDLDKNPLVADMRTEIETLHGRVDGLYSECTWLDRASVIAKVVPDAATKLIRSDEMGMLVVKLVKAFIIYCRCAAFEEVAKLKEPFVMEKMAGYRPSSKQEYDKASDDLENASYPFLSKDVNDPYASLEQLLSKKPKSLRLRLMYSPSSPLRRFILLDNVNLGLMCGPSSPLRCFIILDNVNLGLMCGPSSPFRRFILLDNVNLDLLVGFLPLGILKWVPSSYPHLL
uniref:Uncharacterized protein n=1 Tax=Tanacetum cinerariifolium TaxID=118510 RepID=A0A6L2ME27_TANCI|nr:hypothetical protein [Tanacetum cinerariifolium]